VIAYIVSLFPVLRETFISREIVELERRGIEVLVVSLRPGGQSVGDGERPKAKVLHAPYCSRAVLAGARAEFGRHPLRVLREIWYIVRKLVARPRRVLKFLVVVPKSLYLADLFRREGVRHVHAHWATVPTTCALFISRLCGVPYSFSAHAWDVFTEGNELLLEEKMAQAERVFVCTRFSQRRLIALGGSGDKIELMYHGIELDRYAFVADKRLEPPLVLAGGSLTPQKGLDDMLAALGRLRRQGFEFRAKVFGEGPEHGRLARMVREEGLEERLQFIGTLPHEAVIGLMQEAAVFVMPSKAAGGGFTDGLPNVIAEAMACGAAVVGTRFAGIPELIDDGRTGILAAAGDPVALAEGIGRCLSDQALRARLATAARATVEDVFDVRKNVRPLADYFQRVLSDTSRPGFDFR
jgi:colanic acid/amylovoran biosynthesis glycosyltransferase